MKKLQLLPFLIVFFTATVGEGSAAAITITNNEYALTVSSDESSGFDNFSGTAIPSSVPLEASAADGAFARNLIDYTASGDAASLLNIFDLSRAGAFGNFSYVYGVTQFTAASDTSYEISGAFSVVDGPTGGVVYLRAYLHDDTTDTYLMRNFQESRSTANESFALGGFGGDYPDNFQDIFFGSLTGELIAGHEYEFYFAAFTQAYPDADGGATGTGFARLDIGGGTQPVPDGGATLALFSVGLGGIGLLRRKLSM